MSREVDLIPTEDSDTEEDEGSPYPPSDIVVKHIEQVKRKRGRPRKNQTGKQSSSTSKKNTSTLLEDNSETDNSETEDDFDDNNDEDEEEEDENKILSTEEDNTIFPNDIKTSLASILNKLPIELIKGTAEANSISTNVAVSRKRKTNYKESLVNSIVKRTVHMGLIKFYNALDRSDMKQALSEIKANASKRLIARKLKEQESNSALNNVSENGAHTSASNTVTTNSNIPEDTTLNTLSQRQIQELEIEAKKRDEKIQKLLHSIEEVQFKSKLKVYFRQCFQIMGAETFIMGLSEECQKNFMIALEFSEDGESEESLADAILEEMFISGAKELFSKCLRKLVINICKQLGAKCDLKSTKNVLIQFILGEEFPHMITNGEEMQQKNKSKRKGRPKYQPPADRKPIKEITSKEALLKQYNLSELQQWCRENFVQYATLKKAQVVANIIKFKEGDKNVMMSTHNSNSKRRGRPPKKLNNGSKSKKSKKPNNYTRLAQNNNEETDDENELKEDKDDSSNKEEDYEEEEDSNMEESEEPPSKKVKHNNETLL